MKLIVSPEDTCLVHLAKRGRLDLVQGQFALCVNRIEWIHFVDKGQRTIVATGISEENIGEILAGLQADYGLSLTKITAASSDKYIVFENLSHITPAVIPTRIGPPTTRR